MKFEVRMAKVLVTREEGKRLDKWAIDTCNGEKVRESLQLPSGKTKKVYRFHDAKTREEFLNGLNANFGNTIEVL